ncbi:MULTISPECIES: group II truncated hemoglobin [Thermomonosporaceae]|uniref:group II truncated hemoglobin n=1 Tax=Thermomonosporaceae TaxID=2012 RepID=UPI00255A9F02|nr:MULTISPECIES: group II truncated hemoglobin [Thermomonosporaceae]MDL4776487.1 group II truncated hemoglobin [Actinomadura xylanilytica]
MTTLFEHAGGAEAMRRLADALYRRLLSDPVLRPPFGELMPEHVAHFALFEAETFGGPDDYTRDHGGFPALIDMHRGLKITEAQRRRFVEHYLAAADEAGLPSDAPFREALRTHVEFGTQVAMQNSNAETDDELHPLRHVPIWNWPDPEPGA